MLLLTQSKHQYYDFFLWMSWCIVIEAENTSQMLEEYMTVHLRGLSCHTSLFTPQLVSQCVFLPLKLPVLISHEVVSVFKDSYWVSQTPNSVSILLLPSTE